MKYLKTVLHRIADVIEDRSRSLSFTVEMSSLAST